MQLRLITALLLISSLSACSSTTRGQIPIETSLPTIEPTVTNLPVTPTPELKATPTSQPTRPVLKPPDQPTEKVDAEFDPSVGQWEGVPIIEGASEGKPAGLGYIYTVDIAIEKAEQFYLDKMEADGWSLVKRQANDRSLFGGPFISMDFERKHESFNIMLIFSTNDRYTMVMLTKYHP